jgi:hypothetical protein
MNDLDRYLAHVFGSASFYVLVCTNDRTKPERTGWDEGKLIPYYAGGESTIAHRIKRAVDDRLDVYMAAHGYVDKTGGHKKPNAAPISCLWNEADDAPVPTGALHPTMRIQTSPGKEHWYLRLSRPVASEIGEDLNRRWRAATGGDSGHALTKRLRPPGTRNFKYDGAPDVRIIAIDDQRTVDPDELDRSLPKITNAPIPKTIDIINGFEASDDEPPVALTPAAAAVWRGERPVVKSDGSGVIDRSETLYRIACELWEHGATRRTVAAELAARDQALEWNRYSDRPAEYDRIAAKVAEKPRKVGPLQPTPIVLTAANGHAPAPIQQDAALVPDDAPCDPKLGAALRELERLRQENARLVAQNDQLEEHNRMLRNRIQCADQQLATYRNAKLGASKAVGAALIEVFRHQEPNRPNDPAGYRMPLGRLADRTGQSEDACSRQIKQLGTYKTPDGAPLLNVAVINVPAGLNTITGEIDGESGPHKELWIGPGVDPKAFGELLATLDPGEARKPWGGKTADNKCADHPEDDVIERTTYLQKTTYECSVCNEVLLEQTIPVAGRHPKVRHLSEIPTQQDAASTTTASVDSLYTGKMRGRETAPLFPPLTQAEIEHAYAYASAASPDHLTDISIGRQS